MSRSSSLAASPLPSPLAVKVDIDNFFFLTFVQDDDRVFEQKYDAFVSRELMERENNTRLTFNGFKKSIEQFRKTVSFRRLIHQSELIVPPEHNAQSITAFHQAEVSGIRDGKEVIAHIRAIGVNVIANGQGQLAIENLVLIIDDVKEEEEQQQNGNYGQPLKRRRH